MAAAVTETVKWDGPFYGNSKATHSVTVYVDGKVFSKYLCHCTQQAHALAKEVRP